jgi:hypothetical protein
MIPWEGADGSRGGLFRRAGYPDKSDPGNPILRIVYEGKRAEMPANKNILKIGEKVETLEGVVVYARKTGRATYPWRREHDQRLSGFAPESQRVRLVFQPPLPP